MPMKCMYQMAPPPSATAAAQSAFQFTRPRPIGIAAAHCRAANEPITAAAYERAMNATSQRTGTMSPGFIPVLSWCEEVRSQRGGNMQYFRRARPILNARIAGLWATRGYPARTHRHERQADRVLQ